MKSVYVIGEIGQNHNGSLDMAKRLIDLASMPVIDNDGSGLASMNAVKLQKRDLTQELTQSEMDRVYDSPNAFGRTYGEHRAALELSDVEHAELYRYAKDRNLDFIETVCNPGALSLLNHFTPDRLKVASRDLTNEPLLAAMAETQLPIILSTGMADEDDLERALKIITRYHSDISILHCLSAYPSPFSEINLRTILYLKKHYPQYTIGYSDHTVGIMMPIAAIALGAEIIEKHITLNRNLKGSDQAGSLGPDGVIRMMRDIRHVEMSLGDEIMERSSLATSAQKKLERSIAAKRDLVAGEVITEQDIYLLSPGTGLRWARRGELLGKTLKKDVSRDELILTEYVHVPVFEVASSVVP